MNEILYATASAVCSTLGIKLRIRVYKKLEEPKWETRIQREIDKFRREISRLSEVFNKHQLKEKKRRMIVRKYNVNSKDEILTVTEKLQQPLKAKSQRIRCFDETKLFS